MNLESVVFILYTLGAEFLSILSFKLLGGGLLVVGLKNLVISFFDTLHQGTFDSFALKAHLYFIRLASEEYHQTTGAIASELFNGVRSLT